MYDDIQIEYYEIIKNKILLTRFESALGNVEKLLNYNPNNSMAHYYGGVCNFALGDYLNSVECYLKSISCDVTNAKAYFNLGASYLMLKKYDQALINFAKSTIIFSKRKEIDNVKRCTHAIKVTQNERGIFNWKLFLYCFL